MRRRSPTSPRRLRPPAPPAAGSRRILALSAVTAILVVTGGRALADDVTDPLTSARARLRAATIELVSDQATVRALQSELDRWSARLGAAERQLVLVEREARRAGPAPEVVDDLRLGAARPTVLQVRVATARRHLASLRADAAAGTTLQALFAAQSRISVLQTERAGARSEVELFSRPELSDPAAAEPAAGEWARLFLATIGAPICDDNVITLLAWQAQESTSARFNPLATTYSVPGATAFNGVGVRNYATVAQGLAATRATLELPVESYGYAAILASLRACAPAETSALAVNASAWCRGCSEGAYLTRLIPLVRADPQGYAARV